MNQSRKKFVNVTYMVIWFESDRLHMKLVYNYEKEVDKEENRSVNNFPQIFVIAGKGGKFLNMC